MHSCSYRVNVVLKAPHIRGVLFSLPFTFVLFRLTFLLFPVCFAYSSYRIRFVPVIRASIAFKSSCIRVTFVLHSCCNLLYSSYVRAVFLSDCIRGYSPRMRGDNHFASLRVSSCHNLPFVRDSVSGALLN